MRNVLDRNVAFKELVSVLMSAKPASVKYYIETVGFVVLRWETQ